ncbi:MAG: exo-alpha-sialidase [Clostridia bacterium]|nr:exo-alpha-sialidase [Clostridia bacterium]
MKLCEITLLYPVGEGPTPSCHASTLCTLPDGRIMAAWFGGHHESADDVEIYAAVREPDGRWGTPVQMSRTTEEACWNPVLYRDGEAVTLFFKRGHKIAHWKTFARRSSDGGCTFGAEEELVPGDESGGRGPVKDKPIRLGNGTLIAGASHESEDGKIWRAFFDLSPDGGKTWERTPYLEVTEPLRLIQPTLWEDGDGVHAFLRSNAGVICRADSPDGRTWSAVTKTALANNNSGIDCAALPDGRLALVCNPVGRDWGARTPLSLLVSSDGGRSWKRELDLARGEGEYSYPAVIFAQGELLVTFTWNRKTVAFARVGIE